MQTTVGFCFISTYLFRRSNKNDCLYIRFSDLTCLFVVYCYIWRAGPSSNQGVGGSIPALVDVPWSKTLNPELLPVAASTAASEIHEGKGQN